MMDEKQLVATGYSRIERIRYIEREGLALSGTRNWGQAPGEKRKTYI